MSMSPGSSWTAHHASAAFYGAKRFFIGLAKKVLLADEAGKVVASLIPAVDGTSSRRMARR